MFPYCTRDTYIATYKADRVAIMPGCTGNMPSRAAADARWSLASAGSPVGGRRTAFRAPRSARGSCCGTFPPPDGCVRDVLSCSDHAQTASMAWYLQRQRIRQKKGFTRRLGPSLYCYRCCRLVVCRAVYVLACRWPVAGQGAFLVRASCLLRRPPAKRWATARSAGSRVSSVRPGRVCPNLLSTAEREHRARARDVVGNALALRLAEHTRRLLCRGTCAWLRQPQGRVAEDHLLGLGQLVGGALAAVPPSRRRRRHTMN